MRFKLIETGKSYGDEEKAILTPQNKVSDTPSAHGKEEIPPSRSLAKSSDAELDKTVSKNIHGTHLAGNQALYKEIANWADVDPKLWQRIQNTLLRIYNPRWEYVDARDTLVAWAGAWLAFTRAKHKLQRLQSPKGHLTWNERNEKGGREADISFWGRVIKNFDRQIPLALSMDTEAAKLLEKLCSKKVQYGH